MRWARAEARAGTRPAGFDIALGHGSNDVSVAAALLRIPSATMFDYEWATVQHNVNCRLARAVVVPDAIPPERLERYGARGKLRAYAGLKEEYYLADFEPDAAVLAELGLDPARPIVVVRTPPEVSLYHRFENDLFARRARAAARGRGEEGVQPVVLPRVASQRAELRGVAGFMVPEHAIDAQSLIAFADLVISAGGHDEPRGGRAGHARLHDLPGPAGRGRRTADRRSAACACSSSAEQLELGKRDVARECARRACAATRACSSSCCSPLSLTGRRPRRLGRQGRDRPLQS